MVPCTASKPPIEDFSLGPLPLKGRDTSCVHLTAYNILRPAQSLSVQHIKLNIPENHTAPISPVVLGAALPGIPPVVLVVVVDVDVDKRAQVFAMSLTVRGMERPVMVVSAAARRSAQGSLAVVMVHSHASLSSQIFSVEAFTEKVVRYAVTTWPKEPQIVVQLKKQFGYSAAMAAATAGKFEHCAATPGRCAIKATK